MDVVSEAVFWKHPSSTGATFEVTLNSPSHITVTVEEGIGDPTTEKGADVIVTGDGVKGANVSTGSISVDGDGVIPEQPHATARSRAVTSAKSDPAPLTSPSTPMRNRNPSVCRRGYGVPPATQRNRTANRHGECKGGPKRKKQ